MELVEYMSYDEVRAALGVNDIELPNAKLALGMYVHNLTAELEEVDVGLPAKFVEVSGIDESVRTDKQRRFFETTRMFALYAVAKQLCTTLPMFGPKEVSDSKTSISRFSDSPYKETVKMIKEQYNLNKSRLDKAYGDVMTVEKTMPTQTFLLVSSPTTDRVTG